jgi:hypothetical protein
MRRSPAPSNWPDTFFAAQFSAGYTTNISGFDLRQAQVPRVEGVAERGRGLGGTLKGQHTLVPGFASELIGFLARFGRVLG